MFLGPLSKEEATELVAHLLDVDGLADETRSQILARAEGNPFFLEEILRRLVDEGDRARRGAGGRRHESRVEIPDTVQAVLAARIDLLGAATSKRCSGLRGRACLLDGAVADWSRTRDARTRSSAARGRELVPR